MENTSTRPDEPVSLDADETLADVGSVPRRRVGFFGILLRLIVVVGVLAGAGYLGFGWVQNKPEGVKRQSRERSFTVAVDQITKGNFRPSINAYGEIVAANLIDIRAQVSGTALSVSDNLAVGAHVAASESLVEIDPFNYELAILDAKANLDDVQIQLEVGKEQLRIEKVNLDVSLSQLELAERDLARAEALVTQGSVTNKVVEDRAFLVTQRRQSVAQHESSISVQEAGLKRLQTGIYRADANVQLAERALENTSIVAPFDGVVVSGGVVRGRVISQNEVVAQLYERDKLDVRFTLSDRQYGQLVGAGLVGREVEVIWAIEPASLRATGMVTRAGAQVNAALGGVEVFARLSGEGLADFRAGAFVSVKVDGLEYRDAYKVPETAIYENDHLYVVREGRMARVELTILERDGSQVIINADIGPDEHVILTRVAQAGDGLKVRIEGEEPAFGGPGGGPPGGPGAGAGPAAGQRTGNGGAAGNAGPNGQRPADGARGPRGAGAGQQGGRPQGGGGPGNGGRPANAPASSGGS